MSYGIAPPGNVVTSNTVVVTCLGIGALFFMLNDLLGLINGGGIFSAIAAAKAAHSNLLSVDVDQASRRTPFVIVCALVTTTICMLLRLQIEKRWVQSIFMLCIIGGGFFIDAVYGPSIIENYLTRSGYIRCSTRDHTSGSGKGRVWFNNYVQTHSELCKHSV